MATVKNYVYWFLENRHTYWLRLRNRNVRWCVSHCQDTTSFSLRSRQSFSLLKLVSSVHSSILILTHGFHSSPWENWNWLMTYFTEDLIRYYDNILFYEVEMTFLTIIIYSQGRRIMLVQCMDSNFTCFWKTWLENPTLLHWHDELFPLLCVTEFKLRALKGEWHTDEDNNTSVISCGQFFGLLLLQHAVFFCEDQECTFLPSRPACSERSFKSLSWLSSFSKKSWMTLQQRLPPRNSARKPHWGSLPFLKK